MTKHRLFAQFALLLVALGSSACAGAGSPGRPIMFYRAESAAGRVTFFYPSFHLRDSRVPRPPMSMLDSVGRLVLEADIIQAKASPETLIPYIVSPKPINLTKFFTAAEIARIQGRAACNGLGAASVEKLRLAFIATIVALPCPKPDGGSYEEGVELAAQGRGLKITALESAEEELAMLATLPDRLFIAEIKSLAKQEDLGEKRFDRMIALYNEGDYDGLYELLLADGPTKAADRKLFMQKVLLDRNRHMVERLADVLAEGNALVVVGALHFPGTGGIVDLLQQQGYRIALVDGRDGALR